MKGFVCYINIAHCIHEEMWTHNTRNDKCQIVNGNIKYSTTNNLPHVLQPQQDVSHACLKTFETFPHV